MAVKKIAPGKTRIGWIGTGVMGSSMCGHLIAAGFSATVYNRTQGQGQAAARQGRQVGRHAQGRGRGVATWSSASSAFPADVREVILGPDGALAGSKAGNDPGRHDHQRAVAGRRDRRGGQGKGRAQRRCAGLRRRRRRARGPAVDHDRRRQGSGRRARRPAGRRWARRSSIRAAAGAGPAHQDGQSDPDRQRT